MGRWLLDQFVRESSKLPFVLEKFEISSVQLVLPSFTEEVDRGLSINLVASRGLLAASKGCDFSILLVTA